MLGYSTANSEGIYFRTNFNLNFDTLLRCRCIFWWCMASLELGLGSLSGFQAKCRHLQEFLGSASPPVNLEALKGSVFLQFLGISNQP